MIQNSVKSKSNPQQYYNYQSITNKQTLQHCCTACSRPTLQASLEETLAREQEKKREERKESGEGKVSKRQVKQTKADDEQKI